MRSSTSSKSELQGRVSGCVSKAAFALARYSDKGILCNSMHMALRLVLKRETTERYVKS